jgi:hypothetical protein
MALFGGHRDFSLIKHFNRELINDIAQQEVGYYKLNLEQTNANLYGESLKKLYYEPILLNCLIVKQDQAYSVDQFGTDVSQNINYAFFRQDLVDIELKPDIGDIILWRNNYWEIDSFVENNFFGGKDPDYSLSEDTRDFGGNVSIIVSTHLARIDKINLVQWNTD